MDAYQAVHDTLVGMGVPAEKVRPAAGLVLDLELDSLEMVELAQQLEEACAVNISDTQMNGGMTVGDCVDLIRRLRGE